MDDATSQYLFLGTFPFEIAARIFSFLRQPDCLTCMAVCRSWYLTVPSYSRDTWSDLSIVDSSIYANQRWERCVGNHVRKLIDYSESPHKVLQRLVDCGCTQIKAIELKGYCNLDDNLVALLSQVSSQSPVEILFDGCSYDKTFIQLLKAFPSLLRFTFIDDRYQDPDLPLFAGLAHLSQDLCLTRLFIKYSRIDVHEPLVTILKKCPNLQYLAYDRATINLDQLFSWCPKLVYLEADAEDLHKCRCNVINRLCLDFASDSLGLRAFIGRDSSQIPPSMIGYHLMRNADTLEHLILGTSMRDVMDWSATLNGMRFPRLRTFIDMYIKFEDGAMDAMLSHCPSLTELTLLGTWSSKIDLQVVLSSLPQLELINLQDIGLSYDTDQAITRLFEELIANRSKISSITLSRIGPTPDTLLLALSLLPSLKRLEIGLDQSAYTDDALCQSVQRLSRTPIEALYLNNLRCVPEAAMTALYKLSRLEKLKLHGRSFDVKSGTTSLLQIFEHCNSLRYLYINGLVVSGGEGDSAAYFKRKGTSYTIDSIYERNGCYNVFLHATNKMW